MRMNLKPPSCAIIVALIFFVSCGSDKKNEIDNSKLLQKIDSLNNENRKLTEQLSPTQKQQSNTDVPLSSGTGNNVSVLKVSYAFVVLTVKITEPYYSEVLQKMTTKTEDYSACSKVKQFDVFNDELKYQFMDEIQADYMKGRMQSGSYSTKIVNRQCFAFDSYEGASKEREKYLILKEQFSN